MDNGLSFDLIWLSTILGFFTPLLISFIKKNEWSQRAKKWTAFIVSAIIGVVSVGVEAGFAGSVVDLLALAAHSIINVYVVATVTYLAFFEDSAVEVALANTMSEQNKVVDET